MVSFVPKIRQCLFLTPVLLRFYKVLDFIMLPIMFQIIVLSLFIMNPKCMTMNGIDRDESVSFCPETFNTTINVLIANDVKCYDVL